MKGNSNRIDRHSFEKVMKEGKSLHSGIVSIKYLRSAPTDGRARFSAVVSKKNYKKAVDRNKLKRRGRAIFLKVATKLPVGFYILFLKKGMLEMSFKDLETEIGSVLLRF